MITIVPSRHAWPDEFHSLGTALRQVLGPLALRIDHIGSTSVPGLEAKDIIDIQVTAAALSPELEQAVDGAGYVRIHGVVADHVPESWTGPADDWYKWLFRPTPGTRPCNVHVRLQNRPNQRYALLFRDYLRSHEQPAGAYGLLKRNLARLAGDDVEAYYDVKDPACDIIMAAAEAWAEISGWMPGPSDC
jgi:GrpB-like predicted nucleotidyltransferase (UPF0157 family)